MFLHACLVYPCIYTLLLGVCLSEHAYLVRRVAVGKRLTFPHSWGHLGHAPGVENKMYEDGRRVGAVKRECERWRTGKNRAREGEMKTPGASNCGGIPDRCYWRGNPLWSISLQGSCSL